MKLKMTVKEVKVFTKIMMLFIITEIFAIIYMWHGSALMYALALEVCLLTYLLHIIKKRREGGKSGD